VIKFIAVAFIAIVGLFGALNGWTMICAELPLAGAEDGLFPERFKRMSNNGVPAFGIVASTVLASIAMAINYIGSGGATVFTTLVLMTGITAAQCRPQLLGVLGAVLPGRGRDAGRHSRLPGPARPAR
jgi:amino acid transporter